MLEADAGAVETVGQKSCLCMTGIVGDTVWCSVWFLLFLRLSLYQWYEQAWEDFIWSMKIPFAVLKTCDLKSVMKGKCAERAKNTQKNTNNSQNRWNN